MALLQVRPLREPRANQISTSIFFYSPKLQRQVWCESNLEWDTAILLDHDPTVISYCEQAVEVEWSKSAWTPDFVALVREGDGYKLLVIEVKYVRELLERKEHFVRKYDETRAWIKRNEVTLARALTPLPVTGVELLLATDLNLQQSVRVRNLRKLIQPVIEGAYDPGVARRAARVVEEMGRVTFGDLVDAVEALYKRDRPPADLLHATLHAMIYRGEVFVDLDRFLGPAAVVHATNPDPTSLTSWLARNDWREEGSYFPPLIEYTDLYYVAPTPEQSIRYWEEAVARLEAILPLLECSIEELKARAIWRAGQRVHWHTAYLWRLAYKRAGGDVRALLPSRCNSGRKVTAETAFDKEVWEFGRDQYLRLERKSIKRAHEHMRAYARERGKVNRCMSYSSFYRRIKALDPREVTKRRHGTRNAEKAFELTEAEFPHADFPLQAVQVDHTPIDVLVVDEEDRLVTERPYLTVAFDCATRCILGYHVTYQEPSRLSLAMTLLNCVEPKTATLQKVAAQFPGLPGDALEVVETSGWRDVYGLPYTIHVDNGPDLRSADVRLFGARYKVHLHYRAVKKPQHGAHVERVLGTLNHRLHGIAGTTFSNARARGDYPAEKRASYTIDELEARILTEILYYHEDVHHQLRTSPLQKWREAFGRKGTEGALTRNLTHVTPGTFHFDVLPSERRTVQKRGVQLFGLAYAHPQIQKWIGARDPDAPDGKQQFLVRYDPRDVRTVFFYDPVERGYYPLKCNDRFVQTYYRDRKLTLWQWQAIKRDARALAGPGHPFEARKLAYLRGQQAMDVETARRTKGARIKRARARASVAQHAEFEKAAGLTAEDLEALEGVDFSAFQLEFDVDDMEEVYIPPDHENPFFGIYLDDDPEPKPEHPREEQGEEN